MLLEVDGVEKDFAEDRIDLLEALQALAEHRPLEKDSVLRLLYEESRIEPGDEGSLDLEVRSAAKEIKIRLGRMSSAAALREAQEFNGRFQQFQTGGLTAREVALTISELAARLHLPLAKSLQFGEAAVRQKRIQDIKGTRVFDEFENYLQSVKESLFRNEEKKSSTAFRIWPHSPRVFPVSN